MVKTYSKHDLMKLAIEEHLKCSEYPRVGALVAKDGVVLSTGYRGEVGKLHAERVALEKLGMDVRIGSTVYTTLEPCVNLHSGQAVESCSDLIISSGVSSVVIGVLDPNGTIYSQGFRKLLENNISVSFFSRKFRDAVEEETFEFGEVHRVYGSGKRRVPVVHSGIDISVQFSELDSRTISISWNTLQPSHGCVDLTSDNGAVRVAAGTKNFSDITDPDVFRFPSHIARMRKGMISIVKPPDATFCVLVKLHEIFENDILFQWEVRNSN
ncbi:CMP deaminase [Pseudomonas sp. NFACC39-1]|uniref:CMP deaminase n=1 Tax=Pseudomonas sp. NFACC39-1 TaxID=1566195 RepID=UPI0008ADBA10|nr:CMP deaminase [Pseudomonas sp. NFACC39-1]SEN65162.1 diaminohydroxyphosphoribosylaminopyrimidine deaminase [Pseudomonas sp. NFACC39-1]